MWTLALACAFFLCIHMMVSGTVIKDHIITAIGVRAYYALFSLLSIGGFFWMVGAFFDARTHELNVHFWEAPMALKILAFGVNFIGIMLLVIGILSPSPTNLRALSRMPENPISGIIRVTRHPVLVGIALLALTHMLCNGNLAAWMFFGTLFALCLLGANHIDVKRDATIGPNYAIIRKHTSIIPFLAIAQGRIRFEPSELGVLRVLMATSVFTFLVVLHELLFWRPAL